MHRPFDINITLTNQTQIRINKNTLVKPLNPKTYRCNESHEYENLEYGAKCSCKVCLLHNIIYSRSSTHIRLHSKNINFIITHFLSQSRLAFNYVIIIIIYTISMSAIISIIIMIIYYQIM
jgi:hypothetical protein